MTPLTECCCVPGITRGWNSSLASRVLSAHTIFTVLVHSTPGTGSRRMHSDGAFRWYVSRQRSTVSVQAPSRTTSTLKPLKCGRGCSAALMSTPTPGWHTWNALTGG